MGLKTLNQFGVKLLSSHIETCCMKLLRPSNPLYFVKAFDPDQAHKYQHDNKSLQLVENCGTSLCNFS
jgi:hypothetical protein